MKRFIFIPLLFLSGAILADGPSQTIGGQWKGLHNADDSLTIEDNEAQSLQDVDISLNSGALKKRPGYTQYLSIGESTVSVRGGYFFRDAGGNDVLVHTNNKSVFKSVNSAAYSAFITTDTALSYYDFTDSQGYLYRATNNRDQFIRYDGTTLTYYPSNPMGTQVEALSDRLAVSGVASNPNRVYFSAQADFTNYVIGILESDPFTEDFGLPGQSIIAIKYAFGGLLVWTKNTLSIWSGTNQYDGRIDGISSTVGTLQPGSILVDQNAVFFQGQDGHFYVYDGNILSILSQKLDISGFEASSNITGWEQTTQSDFGSGIFGQGVSSTTSPGDVYYGDEVAIGAGACETVSQYINSVAVAQSFTPDSSFVTNQAYVSLHGAGGTSPVGISTWTIRTDNSGSPSSTILSTAIFSTQIPSSPNETTYLTFSTALSFTAGTKYWIYVSSPSYSGGNVCWNGPSNYSGGNAWRSGVAQSFDFQAIIFSTASYYYSQSHNVGSSITGWGPFLVNTVPDGSTVTYALYKGSSASIDPANSATWASSQTITNGAIPSFSVGAYVLWTASFIRSGESAQNIDPTINDATIQWYDVGKAYTTTSTVDKDHRLIWSLAEGSTTTANVSYIYDPNTVSWLKYSFPMQAAPLVSGVNYFGGAGKVFSWPSGTTDNGSAITAYWKSKDFLSGDPFTEKDFIKYSFLAKTQPGSNLDVTYTINTSSSITNNHTLTDSNSVTKRRINSRFPSGKCGTFINLQFGNDDSDSPFELYVFKFDYAPRPWRVMQ